MKPPLNFFHRSDELYNFFQLWAHDIYGELKAEEVATRGFILVEEDTDLWTEQDREKAEAEDGISGELTEMTKESWEVRTTMDWQWSGYHHLRQNIR